MRWVGYVSLKGETRNAYNVPVENVKQDTTENNLLLALNVCET
jgi:hypothetical protein